LLLFLTVALFLGSSRAAFYSMAKAFLESIEHALLHRVPTMGADWAGVLYEYQSMHWATCIVRGWRASTWEGMEGRGSRGGGYEMDNTGIGPGSVLGLTTSLDHSADVFAWRLEQH
jgi:hypothetical protein